MKLGQLHVIEWGAARICNVRHKVQSLNSQCLYDLVPLKMLISATRTFTTQLLAYFIALFTVQTHKIGPLDDTYSIFVFDWFSSGFVNCSVLLAVDRCLKIYSVNAKKEPETLHVLNFCCWCVEVHRVHTIILWIQILSYIHIWKRRRFPSLLSLFYVRLSRFSFGYFTVTIWIVFRSYFKDSTLHCWFQHKNR